MKKIRLTLLLLVLPLFVEAGPSVYVNIGEPNFKKPVIAVSAHSKEIEKVVLSDLKMSNVFMTLEADLYPPDTVNAGILEWKLSGAEYLALVNTGTFGTGVKLFELKSGEELLNKGVDKYSDAIDTAHSISDLIYERLTGAKSIFKTKIAAICRDKNGFKNLYIMDYDGKRIKQLTYYKTICLSPAMSYDGMKVAYTRYSARRVRGKGTLTVQELYIRDIQSGRETLVSGGTGQNSGATWSPDGKNVVFTHSRYGDPDLYIYSVDDKSIQPLIKNPGLDVEPAYSPDGKFIVFSSSKTGNPELYKLELSTKKQTRLTFNRHYNSSPEWSPDGGLIAFAGLDNPFGRRSYFDIFTVDPSANGVDRFTIDNGNNEEPSWSGDGRHLIFSSNRNKGSDIYFINRDGTGETRLTSGIECYSPDWSKR